MTITFFVTGFSLNGELLVDPHAGDAAFSEVLAGESAFVPALTLDIGQRVKVNFGHDVDTLKFFTTCGLQEGIFRFSSLSSYFFVNLLQHVLPFHIASLSTPGIFLGVCLAELPFF